MSASSAKSSSNSSGSDVPPAGAGALAPDLGRHIESERLAPCILGSGHANDPLGDPVSLSFEPIVRAPNFELRLDARRVDC